MTLGEMTRRSYPELAKVGGYEVSVALLLSRSFPGWLGTMNTFLNLKMYLPRVILLGLSGTVFLRERAR